MEKFPLMSPAKMFAYMKERESKREQQEVHEVTSSTRELFSGGECVLKLEDLNLTEPCRHSSCFAFSMSSLKSFSAAQHSFVYVVMDIFFHR